MEPKYRIQEEVTNGFNVLSSNLTKEECKKMYDDYIRNGINPYYLKIVRES